MKVINKFIYKCKLRKELSKPKHNGMSPKLKRQAIKYGYDINLMYKK
jgi:hypothetical protein